MYATIEKTTYTYCENVTRYTHILQIFCAHEATGQQTMHGIVQTVFKHYANSLPII